MRLLQLLATTSFSAILALGCASSTETITDGEKRGKDRPTLEAAVTTSIQQVIENQLTTPASMQSANVYWRASSQTSGGKVVHYSVAFLKGDAILNSKSVDLRGNQRRRVELDRDDFYPVITVAFQGADSDYRVVAFPETFDPDENKYATRVRYTRDGAIYESHIKLDHNESESGAYLMHTLARTPADGGAPVIIARSRRGPASDANAWVKLVAVD